MRPIKPMPKDPIDGAFYNDDTKHPAVAIRRFDGMKGEWVDEHEYAFRVSKRQPAGDAHA